MKVRNHSENSKFIFGEEYRGFHRYRQSLKGILGPCHRCFFPHGPIGTMLYYLTHNRDSKVFMVAAQHDIEDLNQMLGFISRPEIMKMLMVDRDIKGLLQELRDEF